MPDPNADPSPVVPEQLPPGRIGFAVDQVALVALVFVATLLLLLGATRLVDRGSAAPGPIIQRRRGRSVGQPLSDGQHEPGTRDHRAAPVSKRTRRAARQLALPDRRSRAGRRRRHRAMRLGRRRGDRGAARRDRRDRVHRRRQRLRERHGRAVPRVLRHRAGAAIAPGPGRRPGTTTGRRRGLAGYFGYFGDAAKGPGGSSWYSYDLGTLARHRPRLGVREGRRMRCRVAAGRLAGGRSGGQPMRACTLAIFHHPAFQLGRARGLAGDGRLLAAAVRSRRRRRSSTATTTTTSASLRRTPTAGSTATGASASSSSARAERLCATSPGWRPTASCGRSSATACSP